MKCFELVLLAVCVVGAFARPDGGEEPSEADKAKWQEKHKQHVECAMATKNLTTCCPMPKHEELKNDPECKVHLEGLEDKDEKQKGRAMVCFIECLFKNKGLIEGHDVKWDKLKEFTTSDGEADFKDVSLKAIDFCEAKGESSIPAKPTPKQEIN
jgi:hypothetical protein